MDIIVKAKNCDVPERTKERAVERVQHATRLFDRLTGIEMVFAEEGNPRIPEPATVELTAHAKGTHIRAEGTGPDHKTAVDVAVARFERQLRRYKSRLVDRSQRGSHRSGDGEVANHDLVPREAEEVSTDDPAPRIVRYKQFPVAEMLPEDAALQLELLGHDFFLFTNAATGNCNVVYRRRDGDLGLIEPA